MEAAEAISLATQFILWRNLDYPTEGLEAERFDAGWTVFAAAARVGRSVFLVGDSGRVEEVSWSIPQRQAQAEFTAQELAAQHTDGGSDVSEFLAEFERQLRQDESEGPSATGGFTIVDTPPEVGDTHALSDDVQPPGEPRD